VRGPGVRAFDIPSEVTVTMMLPAVSGPGARHGATLSWSNSAASAYLVGGQAYYSLSPSLYEVKP
jgi:hypothetical protein